MLSNLRSKILSHLSVEMGGLCSKANIAILEKDVIIAAKKVVADPAVLASVEKAVGELVADVKEDIKEVKANNEPKADNEPKVDNEPKTENEPKAPTVNTVV